MSWTTLRSPDQATPVPPATLGACRDELDIGGSPSQEIQGCRVRLTLMTAEAPAMVSVLLQFVQSLADVLVTIGHTPQMR